MTDLKCSFAKTYFWNSLSPASGQIQTVQLADIFPDCFQNYGGLKATQVSYLPGALKGKAWDSNGWEVSLE